MFKFFFLFTFFLYAAPTYLINQAWAVPLFIYLLNDDVDATLYVNSVSMDTLDMKHAVWSIISVT